MGVGDGRRMLNSGEKDLVQSTEYMRDDTHLQR